MSLALFDLDNTLIAGDSDHLWGDFLVAHGRVDGREHKALNAHFYELYKKGELDIDEYLAFALGPMAGMTPESLAPFNVSFFVTTLNLFCSMLHLTSCKNTESKATRSLSSRRPTHS